MPMQVTSQVLHDGEVNAVMQFTGVHDGTGGETLEPKVVASLVDPLPESVPPTLTVGIPPDADMEALRRALAAFPGRSPVLVRAAGRLVRLPRAQRVDADRARGELAALYGHQNVSVG